MLAKEKKYIRNIIDPETTLDLIADRSRVMVLRSTPIRIQVAEEKYVAYNLITPTELLLQGKETGSTVLNLWFGNAADPSRQEVLTFLVRVFPDPEAKERLERTYQALADEINRFFCDSCIQIKLLGDKMVVSGRVRDVVQGTQILRIVRANAPAGRNQASRVPVERVSLNVDAAALRGRTASRRRRCRTS